MKVSALIYDVEIAKCIPQKDVPNNPKYQYCEGWHDYSGMGISCIVAYDFLTDSYRVFLEDNLDEFQKLIDSRTILAGFNSFAFDDKLMQANGIAAHTEYDLLCEAREATGQPRHYVRGQTKTGYSLDALAKSTLGYSKSGNGALAPQLWQDGKFGQVIDYCMRDVCLTKQLIERGYITDPHSEINIGLKPIWSIDPEGLPF